MCANTKSEIYVCIVVDKRALGTPGMNRTRPHANSATCHRRARPLRAWCPRHTAKFGCALTPGLLLLNIFCVPDLLPAAGEQSTQVSDTTLPHSHLPVMTHAHADGRAQADVDVVVEGVQSMLSLNQKYTLLPRVIGHANTPVYRSEDGQAYVYYWATAHTSANTSATYPIFASYYAAIDAGYYGQTVTIDGQKVIAKTSDGYTGATSSGTSPIATSSANDTAAASSTTHPSTDTAAPSGAGRWIIGPNHTQPEEWAYSKHLQVPGKPTSATPWSEQIQDPKTGNYSWFINPHIRPVLVVEGGWGPKDEPSPATVVEGVQSMLSLNQEYDLLPRVVGHKKTPVYRSEDGKACLYYWAARGSDTGRWIIGPNHTQPEEWAYSKRLQVAGKPELASPWSEQIQDPQTGHYSWVANPSIGVTSCDGPCAVVDVAARLRLRRNTTAGDTFSLSASISPAPALPLAAPALPLAAPALPLAARYLV